MWVISMLPKRLMSLRRRIASQGQLRRAIPAVAALWLTQCAPSGRAGTDIDQLRALHEKVILAHRQSDVEVLLEDEAADYVVASRGEVTRPTLDERKERLGPYLRSATFREYRDLIDPVIQVSSDGTLGWVIVQVQASGVRTTQADRKEPIEFTSAWIELYEKRNGRWFRVGNVSNFKS